MTDIVLQWEDTRGKQLGIYIGNESDGYHLTVGGYSGDSGRYKYWQSERHILSYSGRILGGCIQVLILVVRTTLGGNLGDAGLF